MWEILARASIWGYFNNFTKYDGDTYNNTILVSFVQVISPKDPDIAIQYRLKTDGMGTPATRDTDYLGGRHWLPRHWLPDTGNP
jgi:hypothetical protein